MAAAETETMTVGQGRETPSPRHMETEAGGLRLTEHPMVTEVIDQKLRGHIEIGNCSGLTMRTAGTGKVTGQAENGWLNSAAQQIMSAEAKSKPLNEHNYANMSAVLFGW